MLKRGLYNLIITCVIFSLFVTCCVLSLLEKLLKQQLSSSLEKYSINLNEMPSSIYINFYIVTYNKSALLSGRIAMLFTVTYLNS